MLLMILSGTLIQVIVMVIVITVLLVLLTGPCVSACHFLNTVYTGQHYNLKCNAGVVLTSNF